LCAKLSGVLPAEITCVSHAAREFHEHFGYSSKKLKVIPNGFDLSRFKPNVAARSRIRSELKISSGAQVVGLVARFDPQKDHETFISGAALVQRQLPNTVFLLCGDGVDCRNQLLLRHIESSGGKAAFRMLGRRDDIADVTAAFDVAVNCSVAEGFSNAIGEAMACGIPCVVTDVGDSAQVVGLTGIVVPPRNPEALAAGILRLLTAPNYAALSSAARTRIHDEFEIEKITAKYLDLYRGVLARN
jgi:glycosyltransferase involved in cell wall biosynthesis